MRLLRMLSRCVGCRVRHRPALLCAQRNSDGPRLSRYCTCMFLIRFSKSTSFFCSQCLCTSLCKCSPKPTGSSRYASCRVSFTGPTTSHSSVILWFLESWQDSTTCIHTKARSHPPAAVFNSYLPDTLTVPLDTTCDDPSCHTA
ncbi:hypothetical protein K466DRAFT_49816 [Polyporus arcularius HHB13444]|uniref:Uncharacterized protein n=1 Tax=Polyporus arcularius HHB13444 TaxID=1314778 RepID=A0A5C3PWN9_9APHY|nr:hypothetical protein K466DRAFT_49816 [Polyporus arcularius HHB13444]